MREQFKQSALKVIDIEQQAIGQLSQYIGEDFARACQLVLECKGKVVVSGMGKSGHVGKKIAATLASTGTPSFFMHPAEANHGDLGMISENDVLLAILLPVVKRLGIPIISMCSNPTSSLAKYADTNICIRVEKEACSLGLAPTSSTTATLVMGDALAIALLDANGFTSEDFALSHPGGSLGRKLLLKIHDIMQTGSEIPLVSKGQTISSALLEISSKGLGMTGIVDDRKRLLGIFTDGDLRRILDDQIDIHSTEVDQVMTKRSVVCSPDMLAVEALNLMEKHKISAMFAVDENNVPVGALNMHGLLRAGVV
jgi:arabinose-5-phosphate isomerase